jgi:hypothetical protein
MHSITRGPASLPRAAILTALVFISVPGSAQMTPVGLWRSVDDKTGEAKAEVRARRMAKTCGRAAASSTPRTAANTGCA